MRIRYYIDPTTGLPHIYEHRIAEPEVEDIFSNPTQDLRGRDDSRIAIGQTQAGRYLKVIYTVDTLPDSVFVITGMSWVQKPSAQSDANEGRSDAKQEQVSAWMERGASS